MDDELRGDLECAVCLQICIHPTQLPCGHIFCFLCVKGVAFQNRRCAMCRQDIPSDYLDHPVLVEQETESSEVNDEALPEGYQWYYEGRNGWWKYDARTNAELEEAWSSGARRVEMLLVGALYTADFDSMLQVRRNDPTRRRRIKRDAPTIVAKGVAGIKSANTLLSEQAASEVSQRVKTPEQVESGDETVPPANTPATPASQLPSGHTTPPTPPHHSLATALIRSLSLNDREELDLQLHSQLLASDEETV